MGESRQISAAELWYNIRMKEKNLSVKTKVLLFLGLMVSLFLLSNIYSIYREKPMRKALIRF